jgi:hypothetical protein
MRANSSTADYYAVLQVHPDADREVIEAAYRQLMKKYHPDLAGTDPRLAAVHHDRSKAINEAYRVLRDPDQRRLYDLMRIEVGVRPPPTSPGVPPGWAVPPTAPPQNGAVVSPEQYAPAAPASGPLGILSAAYYLLPGPYEWEQGRKQELLAVCLLPPLGVVAFLLATGRLVPYLGSSFQATTVAWVILLLVSFPTWRTLPRMVVAAAPSALLLTGMLDGFLASSTLPAWLLAIIFGLISLLIAARIYVFAVLPMLAICYLITTYF